MKRLAILTAAVVAALLTTSGAAFADGQGEGCGGGYTGSAVVAPASYRSTHWESGDDTLSLDAPRGWSFVRTATGEGRFHDATGHGLLSLGRVTTSGTPAAQLQARVKSLAGTTGLDIVAERKKVDPQGRQTSTLIYRWTTMGEPHWVSVRWVASGTGAADPATMVLTVAGRTLDTPALQTVLTRVGPSVELAG